MTRTAIVALSLAGATGIAIFALLVHFGQHELALIVLFIFALMGIV